jgi:mono/diheme cytochrome c family protein
MVLIALTFTFVPMNLMAGEKVEKMHSGPHDEWRVPKEAEQRSNPNAPTPDSITQGKDLFQKNCVLCHGPEGHGDGPAAAGLATKPSNLVETAAHHSAGNLAWKIENGRTPMPAWKGILSESQIWDLVNYIRNLGKHPGSH